MSRSFRCYIIFSYTGRHGPHLLMFPPDISASLAISCVRLYQQITMMQTTAITGDKLIHYVTVTYFVAKKHNHWNGIDNTLQLFFFSFHTVEASSTLWQIWNFSMVVQLSQWIMSKSLYQHHAMKSRRIILSHSFTAVKPRCNALNRLNNFSACHQEIESQITRSSYNLENWLLHK